MVFLSERISKHVFKTRFRINVLDVTHIIFFNSKYGQTGKFTDLGKMVN